MKTILEKLKVNKNTSNDAHDTLVSEVQNEYGDTEAYQSFSWEEGAKQYKVGYIAASSDDEYFAVIAYDPDENNSDQDGLFWDYGLDIEEAEELKVGQSRSGKPGCSVTRIW